MKISVIGIGYVGLVVAAGFAENGNHVICVDNDERKINDLKSGIIPIYEPGLDELVKSNVRDGRLVFTTNIKEGVTGCEVIFLALPTPPNEDGSADLSYVLDTAVEIGKYFDGYKVIVNKSTVPVGTSDRVRDVIAKTSGFDFDVVSNPEFLKEGTAVNDFLMPDRIVVGSSSKKAIDVMQELYAPFIRTGNPLLIMSERSSELTKYASNSFLAAKISFMNEIANLCDEVDADVESVRIGMGTDARIGMKFLFPGIGYGGSCFPKDVKALVKTSSEHGVELSILKKVEEVNEKQKKIIVKKIQKHFKGDLKGRTISLWGLSFKPKTDDVREAPSIVIINELLKLGCKIKVHDPIAMDSMKKILNDGLVEYYEKNYDALNDADALVIATEWNEFRRPDFHEIKKRMKTPVVFDGRNIYSPAKLKEQGFTYYGIGRG
jgi:UDPglucose 6-dehydrogenase